jgi:AcrR family transcriptional regulator
MQASTGVTRRRGRPPREIDETALQNAAVGVFANDGYFGASVDEISQRAGASKALLFRRFETKDALFDWAVEHEVRFLTEHLFRAYAQADQRSVTGALRAGVDAIIAYAIDRPDGFRLLFQTGFTAGQGATPAWEKVRSVVTDRVSNVVAARLDRTDGAKRVLAAGVLASAIVGACEHVARRLVDEPGLDPEAASVLLTEFLAVGMRGLSPEALDALDRRRRQK